MFVCLYVCTHVLIQIWLRSCLLQTTQAQGKKVLLVLHQRHLFDNNLPSQFKPITERWNDEKLLFRTPVGSNDDWYWMFAALWLHKDVKVLTNDEMRDHHFQMLSHRTFQRWKERHQIHFDIGSWLPDHTREVITMPPTEYSIRMQRDPESGAWHVPCLLDEHEPVAEDFVSESRPIRADSVVWHCISPVPSPNASSPSPPPSTALSYAAAAAAGAAAEPGP